jgi:hypothetical protein
MTALARQRAATLTDVLLDDDGSVPIPAEAADSEFIKEIINNQAHGDEVLEHLCHHPNDIHDTAALYAILAALLVGKHTLGPRYGVMVLGDPRFQNDPIIVRAAAKLVEDNLADISRADAIKVAQIAYRGAITCPSQDDSPEIARIASSAASRLISLIPNEDLRYELTFKLAATTYLAQIIGLATTRQNIWLRELMNIPRLDTVILLYQMAAGDLRPLAQLVSKDPSTEPKLIDPLNLNFADSFKALGLDGIRRFITNELGMAFQDIFLSRDPINGALCKLIPRVLVQFLLTSGSTETSPAATEHAESESITQEREARRFLIFLAEKDQDQDPAHLSISTLAALFFRELNQRASP